MHIERIHFDEVFDVQASRGDFSFRSRGRPHYGVNLQNRVVPESGSTFAVAFEKPGDWQRVLGSRDLASGKVVLARPTWIGLLLQADFFLFGLPFLVGTLLMGGFWAGLVLGALLLLALYVLVIFRCLRAASLSYDLFGRLLATGIAVMLLVQVFINVGVNVRLLPVTGIPLPFISQGGSSLVMTFMAMGLVESVLLRRRPFEP